MVTELTSIKLGERPKVLLIGNGINRAFESCKSAEGLVRRALERNGSEIPYSEIRRLPFPMQMIAATGNNVRGEMREITKEMLQIDVPEEQKRLVEKILSCGFDAILTTNYSLEIEKTVFGNSWNPRYSYTKEKEDPRSNFCNYRYTTLPLQKPASIWHIHGTANNLDTVVIGHYFYAKLMSKVVERAGSLIGIIAKLEKEGRDFVPKSWIDYFLLGDVYVMGFGMDFTEIDIWWLLDYKDRYREWMQDAKTVVYAPDLSPEKRAMLKTLKCVLPEKPIMNRENDYRAYYEEILDSIRY